MGLNETIAFGTFLIFLVFMLALDLGVFHKKDHVISFKEAGVWVGIWFSLAIVFALVVFCKAEWFHGIDSAESLKNYYASYFPNSNTHVYRDELSFMENLKIYRKTMGMEYLTGYFMEQALSIDNIFVMIMIFMSFGVDKQYYHRVLFWGILGAVILRFIFIFAAAVLIQKFTWVLAVFGFILIYSGIKMFFEKHNEKVDTENHPVVKLASRFLRASPKFDGHNFFTRLDNKLYMTPLFLVLLVIEFSDIIFAVDSIPAVFSITQDPYIVFFSNIFAIMGLRSLFFLLNNVVDRFWLLKFGLGVLLTFIGTKMLLHTFLHIEISTAASLMSIFLILVVSILSSLIFKKPDNRTQKTLES